MEGSKRSSVAFPTGKVALFLVGPKTIIPENGIIVNAKLSYTWLHLLQDKLKLNVSADQGIFVHHSNYHPTDPEGGKGWRAELNEEIADFVNKYERKRKQYRVHICCPSNGTDNKTSGTPVAGPVVVSPPPPGKRRAPSPAASSENKGDGRPNRGGLDAKSTPGPSGTRRCSKRKWSIPQSWKPRPPPVAEVPPTISRKQKQQNGFGHRRQSHIKARRESEVLRRVPAQVGRPPKRSKVQIQRQLVQNEREVEAGISAGIPSVPGPHVFRMKGVEVEHPQMAQDWDQNGEVVVVEEETYDDGDDYFLAGIQGGWQGGRFGAGEGDGNQMDNIEDIQDEDEEEELRQLGIPNEEIKSLCLRRCEGFSNAFMLRMRDEMKNLMRVNSEWMAVFQRCPLAFYFVREILKEEN